MKKKFHYCWLILFSCCMMQGAGFGVVSNCAGLFYEPISRDLGFSIGSISLYSSISVITSAIVMLFATQLLERYRAKVILTLGAICTSAPMLVMSFCYETWQWYLLAIVQGIGLAFTMNLVAPIILNNWFHDKLGLALGLSVSSGGIVGTIMSALLGTIIRNGGWRNAYRVAGITGLLMTVPVCLFVLCMHPEEKNMLPYGEGNRPIHTEKKEIHNHSFIELLKDVRLWKLLPLIAIARINTAFMPHLTTYASSVGFMLVNASLLTTLFMIGNMLSKIIFGTLNDRYGARKCSYLGLGIICIAEGLLLSTGDIAMLVGGLLFGAVSMFSQVQITILCRESWDGTDYAHALIVVQVVSQVFYSAGISGLGFAYDFLKDYRPLLVMLIASLFICGILIYLIFHEKKSKMA